MRRDTVVETRHSIACLEKIGEVLETYDSGHVNHNEIHLLAGLLNQHIVMMTRAIEYLQETEREVKINSDTLSRLREVNDELEVQTIGKLEPFRG